MQTRDVAFHIHTRRSFDSLSNAATLVQACLASGVGTLCITDHDTIAGAHDAKVAATGLPLQVVIGAEYKTDLGDIIGLFLRDEIRTRDAFGVVAEIRAQGGISVLPHPYQGHPEDAELHSAVDAIEVFNSRCTLEQNERASSLAERLQKPMLAGSDAHFVRELCNVTMRFAGPGELLPRDILLRQRNWDGRSASSTMVRASRGVKGVKRGSVSLATHAMLATLKHALGGVVGLHSRYSVRGAWPQSTPNAS